MATEKRFVHLGSVTSVVAAGMLNPMRDKGGGKVPGGGAREDACDHHATACP